MIVVAVVVFMLIHLSPGDPAALIAGDLATGEDIAKLRVALGLDQPLWRQFVLWLGRLAQGDLGTSIFTNVPVTGLLAQRLEPTLAIAVVTMAITMLVSVPLGTLAAYRAGSWVDRLVMLFSVLAFSVPVFLVGYLLIYSFSIQLGWLPVQGYRRISDGIGPWFAGLILPCVNLALVYIALVTRMTRATVLEVLSEDYIRTARAKGMPERVVIVRHAFRNSLIPIATIVAADFGAMLGGAIITEQVFAFSGMGALFQRGLALPDPNPVMGYFIVIAVLAIAFNFIADMTYSALDPRVRTR